MLLDYIGENKNISYFHYLLFLGLSLSLIFTHANTSTWLILTFYDLAHSSILRTLIQYFLPR